MLGRGRNGNNRFATFRARGSTKEVNLPANAAIELGPNRIGADLAGQVDLQGRVNSHHLVVASDESGIVGIGRGMELEDGIVVHEVEQFLRSQCKSEDDLPRFEGLARARDHTSFNQRNHSIRDEFAVHGEVFAIVEEGKHRVWNAADPSLQYCSIFDESRYIARDGDVQL